MRGVQEEVSLSDTAIFTHQDVRACHPSRRYGFVGCVDGYVHIVTHACYLDGWLVVGKCTACGDEQTNGDSDGGL